MIHSYVIGRGNTATAYLQAGMIRPVPDATADAVVDVQAALGRRVPGEATLSWAGRILTPNAGGKAPQKIYWEGNILNKISKKIVALVTMAAFVLTLAPVAAFAAPTDVDANSSNYTVSTDAAGNLKVTLNLQQASSAGNASDFTNNTVKVTVSNTDSTTTVSGGSASTVDDLATVGVTPQAYNDTFTFANVPTGNHVVTVELTTDNTAGTVAWTTLATTTATSTTVNAANAKAPVVYVSADADRQTSNFLTVKSNVNVDINENVDAVFEINDNSGKPSNLELADVKIWAVEKGHAITDASSALKVDGTQVEEADMYTAAVTNVTDNKGVKVSFTRAGEYTLYAGVAATVNNADTMEALSKNLLGSIEGQQVVVVDAAATGDVDGLTIDNATVNPTDAKVYTANDNIKPNNTATATHKVTATIDGFAAKNETFKISTSSSNITVTAKDMNGTAFASGTATTDRNGQFQITYKIAKAGSYKIYLTSEDGYKVTLNVTSADIDHYAADIALADFDASILNKDELKKDSYLSDAVRFVITDNDGVELTTDAADQAIVLAEPAATPDKDYVSLTAPDKFKGEATDFKLAVDNTVDPNVYTLQYTGTADFVAGEYTVRVALEETGAYVDATFTVGEFDENNVEGIKIVPSVDTVAYNKGDEGFTFKVKAVDKNGVEKDITNTTDYSIGVNAIDLLNAQIAGNKVTFKAGITSDEKEKYVGNDITLTVVSEVYSDIETAKVTVVDEGVVEGLAFSSESGETETTNKVGVSVVDADGNVVKTVNAQDTYIYVASQSNADANVEVEATKNVKAGKDGEITIYSDKETTVDVVVAVKTADNALYAGTLTYTIGAKDVNADKIVAMTIGSSDYIVDNDIVAGDAAPYVDSNWRTMVPVRVLAETFGATVDFTDNVITIVDGNTTVVMTVGEETYTVNDAEKTMDTAPVIGEGDRTFVPIRFLAEALGYTVTPLQDANGLTASVVFQK